MGNKRFYKGMTVRCTTTGRTYQVLRTLGEVSVEVYRDGEGHLLVHHTKLEVVS